MHYFLLVLQQKYITSYLNNEHLYHAMNTLFYHFHTILETIYKINSQAYYTRLLQILISKFVTERPAI